MEYIADPLGQKSDTLYAKLSNYASQYHQQCQNPCGVCGKYTQEKLIEIVVFKRSARIFTFTSKGDDFKNKEQINDLEVCIAVRISYE